MREQTVFKRYEIKYIISRAQQQLIKSRMSEYMQNDEFGQSVIYNIYFDTPSFLLIRRSIEKPVYKEKLRLRSYGVASTESMVFLELKKKFKSVVYKRRIKLREKDAMGYLCADMPIASTQISHELDYFRHQYSQPQPTVFISYHREAFYAKSDPNFRITFDEDILWRDVDLSLCSGEYGEPLLKREQVLMEIKTAAAIPLWLVTILSENQIYKTSFSKYGSAYCKLLSKNQAGGSLYA